MVEWCRSPSTTTKAFTIPRRAEVRLRQFRDPLPFRPHDRLTEYLTVGNGAAERKLGMWTDPIRRQVGDLAHH